MTDKKAPAPAGMVACAKGNETTYMHPRDAMEYHNLGLVEADPKFIDDLKKLDAAKRQEKN